MTIGISLALAAALVFLLSLGVLTGMGSRRRGAGWPLTVLSGLFFPAAWVAWYVRDQ